MEFPSQKPPKLRSLKKYAILLVVSIIGTIVLLLILYPAIGYLYYRHVERKLFKDLTPEQRDLYNKWQSEKIIFPEEALEAKPFRDELKQAAANFRKTWKQYEKDGFNLQERYEILKKEKTVPIPPSPDPNMKKFLSFLSKDWESKTTGYIELKDLFSEVDQFNSLIDAYKQLVMSEGYEFDAFSEGIDPSVDQDFPAPDYKAIQVVANLIQLKSLARAESGDYAGATSFAALNLRASKVHPYSSVISRLFALIVLNMGLESLEKVVKECPDPDVLQKVLEFQMVLSFDLPELIRPQAFPQTDWLGYIRQAKRMGLDVRIQGLTAREAFLEWQRSQALYKERFVLPHITDQKERNEIIAFRKSLDRLIGYLSDEKKSGKNYYAAVEALTYSRIFFETAVPNYTEAKTRENYIRTRLNLLILETGKKLDALGRKNTPQESDEKTLDYMKKALMDLFSPRKEPIKSEPVFYSIGPDGNDQKGKILYDPTNGSQSSGDVFIRFDP